MVCQASKILSGKEDLWDQFTFNNVEFLNQEYAGKKRIISKECRIDAYMSDYLIRNGYELEYPENRKFAVTLSHDVDDIYPHLFSILGSSLYSTLKFDPAGVAGQVAWMVKGKKYSPFINFTEIMDLEEKYGCLSSFYFLATNADKFRFRYNIEDLENELGVIIDKGWEVGLHGGYYSYGCEEKIKVEKKRLENVINKNVKGYRNHFLNFSIPGTWEYLANAGFKYDTTIGNNRITGFKNGLCHPYMPFNRKTGREIDILEIPLVLSDFTLMNINHSFKYRWEIAKNIIDKVESCNGVLSILWHNDNFNNSRKSEWIKMYKKILEYCASREAWITSNEQLCDWAYDRM